MFGRAITGFDSMALKFLIRNHPQDLDRTDTSCVNPCRLGDSEGRTFEVEFMTPTAASPFSHKQVFGPRSRFAPPPHFHLLQSEHFKVLSGSGVWHLWGGKNIHLKKGDELTVPPWKWHWFEATSNPDSTDEEKQEQFAVVYRYDKEYAEMEEIFFRNVLTYMDDCVKAGIQTSTFQIMVWCMHNWMVISVPVPGPQWFNFVVSTLVMLILGFVGEFILGFKASYPEYYSPKSKAI